MSHNSLMLLSFSVGIVSGKLCGLEQCMPSSSAYGNSCCCTPGTCLEDKYDTVTQLEPGLWTINTRNDPSAATSGPAQNRALIFKVPSSTDGQHGAFLVLVNGVGLCNSSLTGLRALESREGV